MKRNLILLTLWLITFSFSCNGRIPHPIDFFNKKTEMIKSALTIKSFNWQHKTTEHLNIHYIPTIWTSIKIDSLAEQLEVYYTKNRKILAEINYSKKHDIFFVGPKSQVKEIVGQAVTASPILPECGCVFSNTGTSVMPQILQHELMHSMSFDIWGIPQDFIMAEGIATFAYGTSVCNYQFDAITKYAFQNKFIPSLSKLVKSDWFKYDEIAKYMTGASLVEMVGDKYGTEGIKFLWKTGIEKGAIKFKTNLKQIDKELSNKVNKAIIISDVDWGKLQNGCSNE